MTTLKNIFLLPLLAIGCALATVAATAGPTGKPEFFEAVRTFSYNDCGYQIDVTVGGRPAHFLERARVQICVLAV